MLVIAVAIALVAGAILGHMLMPVYVYVTITVTKEVTVTKTVTVAGASPHVVVNASVPATPKFMLKSYKVVVYGDQVSLLILFKANSTVNITLVGPDNTTLSSITARPGDGMAYLAMASPGATPKAGKYKLIVTDLDGVKVYEKVFEFLGPKLEVLDASLRVFWDNVVKGVIEGISIVVANKGDMPAIVREIVLQVDSKNYTIPMEVAIPVGEAKIDLVHATIVGLDKGSYRVAIVLLDSGGRVLATYTVPVNIR